MARAVSTVIDVALCLLLIGAAVATLTVAPVPSERTDAPDADATAWTLATATTTVPAGEDRQRHDTFAGHLATGVLAEVSVDGAELGSPTYSETVRRRTADATADDTSVSVRWEPYPDAPLEGRLEVGQRPPPGATVATTRLTVATGFDAAEQASSFGVIADSIADAYVGWRFPPARTRLALVDDRTAAETADRYRLVATVTDSNVAAPVADAQTERANEALASDLAAMLEADLRDRYDTPEDAAAALTLETVELVVTRWSP